VAHVVRELVDLRSVHSALLQLARINSPHLDIDAEAQLPHARFWIAGGLDNPNPTSYALVWLVGDELEIIDVATEACARRRGGARTLLTTLLEHYRKLGRKAAFLEVRAGNVAAITLYQHLGFENTRRRRGYYSDGEDALEMRLDLVPQPGLSETPSSHCETPT
jgi:ribosomal-protein-alanine N-acetyltransferase